MISQVNIFLILIKRDFNVSNELAFCIRKLSLIINHRIGLYI